MHELRHRRAAALIPGRVTAVPPETGRYLPDALAAVGRMLAAVDPGLATLVAAIVAVRGGRHGPDGRAIDLDALTAALAIDRAALLPQLLTLDKRASAVLSLDLLDPAWRRDRSVATCNADGRQVRARVGSADEAGDADDVGGVGADGIDSTDGAHGGLASADGAVLLSVGFAELLDTPHPAAAASSPAPVLDGDGLRDITVIAALARSGHGAHLAIRRRRELARETADLAALVTEALGKAGAAGAAGAGPSLLVVEGGAEGLATALLRAELHAGAAPPVVLVERDLLTTPAGDRRMFDDEDETVAAPGELDARVPVPPALLAGMRSLVLWSVPGEGDLPQARLPWLAGCVGPLRHGTAWARGVVAAGLGPGVGDPATSPGVRALARRLADPRDGMAIAAAAQALAARGATTLDEAAARLAASFADRAAMPVPSPSRFDPALLVCDGDALRLLERAAEAASRGARVLAHGPPGGGKSSFVRELAQRMAPGGTVRAVTPADFLARAWGATEKRVRQLWRRAADEGEVLVLDEFEAVCGRRVPDDSGSNAMLTRTLTDQWLLALDDHCLVPLLATTNDVEMVDPAVRRRFSFVLHFGDALSAEQERLAWRRLLGREPPPGWRPCGAAVADVVLAAERCRMLGLADSASLQAAIVTARAERTGNSGRVRPPLAERHTRH